MTLLSTRQRFTHLRTLVRVKLDSPHPLDLQGLVQDVHLDEVMRLPVVLGPRAACTARLAARLRLGKQKDGGRPCVPTASAPRQGCGSGRAVAALGAVRALHQSALQDLIRYDAREVAWQSMPHHGRCGDGRVVIRGVLMPGGDWGDEFRRWGIPEPQRPVPGFRADERQGIREDALREIRGKRLQD